MSHHYWIPVGLGLWLDYGRRPHRDPHKFIVPYKQLCGRNGDNEWLGMTNALILCDLLWKVQKGAETLS